MISGSSILPGNVIHLENSDFPKFLQQMLKAKLNISPIACVILLQYECWVFFRRTYFTILAAQLKNFEKNTKIWEITESNSPRKLNMLN